jgi:hypothetical protein
MNVRGRIRKKSHYVVEVIDERVRSYSLPDRLLKPAAAREDQEVFLGMRPETITWER